MPNPKKPPTLAAPFQGDEPRLVFRRGNRFPRAIAWFGVRSFWGHLWHLAASVVATEDIDSRDWMHPQSPAELTQSIAEHLHAQAKKAETLTEALDSDLWIDFVADTGDDGSISAAVARMIADTYEVPAPVPVPVPVPDSVPVPVPVPAPASHSSPSSLVLPRGHLLIFGGDTAYPVATELEIHNRVIVPFNSVFRTAMDGRRRVLLGIPGNHDWYAGLDGFLRMFRARQGRIDRASRVGSPDMPDRQGNIGHFFRWVEAFRVGKFVAKRPGLPLDGYTPVQRASYFALHLAPRLTLWGADRQLRAVDFQQRLYFAELRDLYPDHGIVLCMADPARAFLENSPAGVDILQALDVSIEGDGLLVLSGDNHHYCREQMGKGGLHVTSGGGGAFLHPARIRRKGVTLPAAEFPGPKASLSLALQVPFAIAHGRSGFLVHIALAIAYIPTYAAAFKTGIPSMTVAIATAVVGTVLSFLLGGWRTGKAFRIGLLALILGASLGFLPVVLTRFLWPLLHGAGLPLYTLPIATVAASIYLGAWLFGGYLAFLTIFGLEHHQAFAALAHPGYKHFVRLRVRKDGSTVDGWVLGKVDPLAKDEKVVLIDRFTWTNPNK